MEAGAAIRDRRSELDDRIIDAAVRVVAERERYVRALVDAVPGSAAR